MTKRGDIKTWNPAELARSASLTAVAARYLRDLQALNYAATTVNSAQKNLMLCIEWLAERAVCDVAEVTRPMLERYQRHLFHYRKEDGSPLAVSTQTDRLKALKGFYAWAVRKHVVPANPASDLTYPRPIQSIPNSLTIAEVKTVLAQPDIGTPLGVRDRAILELLYATGLRRMEVCNVCIDDIEWLRGILRVNQGKGHKDRLVPLGDCAKGWVRLYVENARDCLLADANERRLFVSKSGIPCTPNVMGNTVRRYLKSAEIIKTGACHLFRHSMATHLLDNGADVRYIQEMLGHASLDTTARYTQVSIERLTAVHSACHPSERPRANDATEDENNTPSGR